MESRWPKRTWGNLKEKFLKKKKLKSEKFTIMVIPHSHKGIKNINLPQWAIVGGILVFLAILSFSVVTISKYFYLSMREKEYVSENKKMVIKLENLINNSDILYKVQGNFSLSLNNLLKTAGLSNEISFKMGAGGVLKDAQIKSLNNNVDNEESFQSQSYKQELENLYKMKGEIKNINERIHKLSKKLKHFESVTKYIPSIWPLLGDGEIISSNESTMKIETLPFTPIVATANGKISNILYDQKKKQIKVYIRHKYQFISVYSNLYSLEKNIVIGKNIRKGKVIGYVAKKSGRCFFEYSLFIGNKNRILYPVNPLKFSYLGR